MGKGAFGSASPDIKQACDAIPERARLSGLALAKTSVRLICTWFSVAVPLAVMAAAAVQLSAMHHGTLDSAIADCMGFWDSLPSSSISSAALALCVILGLALWLRSGKRPVYLCDFYTFHPPENLGGDVGMFVDGMRRSQKWNDQSLNFMEKVSNISGLGSQTYFPAEVAVLKDTSCSTLQTSFEGAKAETEMVLFTCIQKVLDSLKIAPHEVDAVIVVCSSYVPVPSVSAAVVNHFKMKSSVLAYNLSGQGCAASIISVDLAKELLQNHPNMRVLIAGSENITNSLYFGNVKSCLITNCIFRLGGMAALMSNCRKDRARAKYRLQHCVRTHLGASDQAYRAVMTHEDEDGLTGIKIGKELMQVAGRALTTNITRLGPLILPLSEKLFYAANLIARKVFKAKIGEYMPDFKTAIDHFAIHPGGKAVIDTVEKALSLRPQQSQPCRAAFERYGNTSSSSTWYAWSYVETLQGVKKGEKLWQLAFGSGFKCNSAVWQALRPIHTTHDAWTETTSC